jgi:hypothetical protein
MTREEKALKEKMDFMRAQVQELELQARYWKAQYDTKYYTLEDDKIKNEYNSFIIKTQEQYLEQLAKERELLQTEEDSENEIAPILNTNEETPE